MAEKHQILGGKVHVYKRPRSAVWQCSTYIEGKNRPVSTKEEILAKAKEFAEDCYLDLRGKRPEANWLRKQHLNKPQRDL